MVLNRSSFESLKTSELELLGEDSEMELGSPAPLRICDSQAHRLADSRTFENTGTSQQGSPYHPRGRLGQSTRWSSGCTRCAAAGVGAGRASQGPVPGAGPLHQAERLQELVDVDAAILVEVNASGKVADAVLRAADVHVGAEELPGLPELIQ